MKLGTLEALVSMAMIVLRQRGQWQGAATAHEDIDWAVNRCSDLLPAGSQSVCDMAVAELKRRCGYAVRTEQPITAPPRSVSKFLAECDAADRKEKA